MDFFKIIILFYVIFNISYILHLIIEIWQDLPLEEEKSTPIYITKEIYEEIK